MPIPIVYPLFSFINNVSDLGEVNLNWFNDLTESHKNETGPRQKETPIAEIETEQRPSSVYTTTESEDDCERSKTLRQHVDQRDADRIPNVGTTHDATSPRVGQVVNAGRCVSTPTVSGKGGVNGE